MLLTCIWIGDPARAASGWVGQWRLFVLVRFQSLCPMRNLQKALTFPEILHPRHVLTHNGHSSASNPARTNRSGRWYIFLPYIHYPCSHRPCDSDHSNTKHGRNSRLSRKDSRKQARVEKKQRKASHSRQSNGHSSSNNIGKRTAQQDHPESPQRKKIRLADSSHPVKPVSHSTSPSKVHDPKLTNKSQDPEAPRRKNRTALEKLADRSNPVAIPRTRVEKDEDAYIAYLEGLLGGGNKKITKKKGKDIAEEFDEDGLGGRSRTSHQSGTSPSPGTRY